ncbi:MAG TPA: TetR/AcrR family transcriptional regulator [Methanomicrobiales archaeon]|nr:TetR/AcrR family transcriptional regulator [Methanomicrobiales archaeon]
MHTLERPVRDRRGRGEALAREDPDRSPKPGQAEPPRNRERVLSAALRLFTTCGFHATPTARISREARVSTGTLFHYFPDKNTLIDQLYLAIQREVAEAIRRQDDGTLPTKQRLERCLRGYISWGMANPEKVRFMDQFYNSPSIGEEVKNEAHREFQWLNDLSGAAIREGVLPDLPREFYWVMVPQILNGVLSLIASGDTGMSPDEIIGHGLGMIWNR